MSSFCIGGDPHIVPESSIRKEMFEDRYFLPGVIHGGEDYLINIYLNDAKSGAPDDPESFEVNYFSKDLIFKAKNEDPSLGDDFYQILLTECESFGCSNDGTGDFASLIEEWPNSISMSNSDLVAWAEGHYVPKDRKEYKIIFQEVVNHEFYVDAYDPKDAIVEFEKMADNNELNFEDGNIIFGGITRITDPDGKETSCNTAYTELESLAEDPSSIHVSLGDGYSIIAEKNMDSDYKEIFVYLKQDDGCVYQDLAIVGEEYEYAENGSVKPIHDRYSVKVYADSDSEDYTTEHLIDRHIEPVLVHHIDWDTEDEEVVLPDAVTITFDIDDEAIADYLSDQYGYCIKSMKIER